MPDKLSEALNKSAKKENDTFKEVVCPSCGAKILLYAKMDYGYCPFCTGRVSLKDAQEGKFSEQLIDHLSGEEYYTLMQEGKEGVSEDVAKTAVEKGSLTAALDLGNAYADKEDYKTAMYYFKIAKNGGDRNAKEMYLTAALNLGWKYIDDYDYQTAMRYLKIAKDGGNEDGKVLHLLCKDKIAYESGDLLLADANKMLSELNAINQNKLSNRCRKYLKYVRDTFKESIDATNDKFYKEWKAAEAVVKQRQAVSERSFTDGGPTGCGIGGSFCGCGAGR